MQDLYCAIREEVDKNRTRMLDLWERIVNIDSGSRNIDGVEAVCDILREEMADIGMISRAVSTDGAGPVLVGEWNIQADKAPLLLIGHMDTVFQNSTAQENPFYIDADGNAHGPGVLDMKAGLVIALAVIRALKAVGYAERPIKCIFAGDEENLHMFSNAKDIMIAEMEGAAAAFNFETGYLDDGFVVGRKGGGIIDLYVHGVPVHSGIAPEKGRSAVLEMAHKIIQIEACNDIPRGKLMNCGKIDGGIGENTVPGECKVSIGIRFPTMEILDEILVDIRAAAEQKHVEGTSADVKLRVIMECMEPTEGVLELFDYLRETADESGYGEIHSVEVGGVSDSGITVSNGIPTVCAMGVKGEGNHTQDEYAVVESLFQRTALAASVICRLDTK